MPISQLPAGGYDFSVPDGHARVSAKPEGSANKGHSISQNTRIMMSEVLPIIVKERL